MVLMILKIGSTSLPNVLFRFEQFVITFLVFSQCFKTLLVFSEHRLNRMLRKPLTGLMIDDRGNKDSKRSATPLMLKRNQFHRPDDFRPDDAPSR